METLIWIAVFLFILKPTLKIAQLLSDARIIAGASHPPSHYFREDS